MSMRKRIPVLTIGITALLLIAQPAVATIIATGCANASSCTLTELIGDATIQVDDLLLTDFSVVQNTGFNLDNVAFGQGYNTNEAGLLSLNHELQISGIGSEILGVSFKATSLAGAIVGTAGELGYKRYSYSGTSRRTLLVQSTTSVGTTKGGSDLGTSSDTWGVGQNPGPSQDLVSIPELTSIWLTDTITFSSDTSGSFLEIGYISDTNAGPGFRNEFFLAQAPEPATVALVGLGLAGIGYQGRRRLRA